ncbi:MAG: aminotransferase class V-fold PLP-dependent enzyme [Methylococcaceae bacterium]
MTLLQRHNEFPQDAKLVYLNHAAVGPWPKRTTEAVKQFAEENTIYGAKHYPSWLKKENKLRSQLQTLINAPSPDDIALVKNTSEALSFVAYGINWQQGDNIVSSNHEFPSNRIPWQSLGNKGVTFRQAAICDAEDPEQALFDLVDHQTRLITISSVQFASGQSINLERIGEFCQQNNILFCIDAIQTLGAIEFDVQRYNADFVMADGHKWMLGPEGLGVFYTKPAAREQLSLTQFGWHMILDSANYDNRPWKINPSAKRFECGSPNMLGIHALSASLSLLLEIGIAEVERSILNHVEQIEENILHNNDLQLLSRQSKNHLSDIVVFQSKSQSNESLFKKLLQHDIICALRGGGIRLSPHFYHSEQELDRVFAVLNKTA